MPTDDDLPRAPRRAKVVRRADDNDEDEPSPAQRRGRKPLILLGLFAGLLVLAAGGTITLFAGRYFIRQQRAIIAAEREAAKEAEKEAKIWTRDEFRSLAVGKAPAELLASLGKPDSTLEDSLGGPDEWRYRKRSADPIAQKVDTRAVLHFKFGKVSHVFFYD